MIALHHNCHLFYVYHGEQIVTMSMPHHSISRIGGFSELSLFLPVLLSFPSSSGSAFTYLNSSGEFWWSWSANDFVA
jgi:hypothetical protein